MNSRSGRRPSPYVPWIVAVCLLFGVSVLLLSLVAMFDTARVPGRLFGDRIEAEPAPRIAAARPATVPVETAESEPRAADALATSPDAGASPPAGAGPAAPQPETEPEPEPEPAAPAPVAASAAPSAAPPGPECGATRCPSGKVCCNASCGTCVDPGQKCSQLVCGMPIGPSSAMCGRNTCDVGEVCCNPSCGICAAPGAPCDTTECTNAIQFPEAQICGMATCGAGMVCCNPSCGVCAPPGAACDQAACD